jgi:hypothetical protein
MAELEVVFVHCQIFWGQIYKFSPSSGGHAPVNCVRRQSLVLQPLSTVVRSLGDRRVAFTRLGWFSVRIACEGCKPGFFAVVWWIWLFGGSWRFRAEGLVFWCRRVRCTRCHRRWLSRQRLSSVELFLFCFSLCLFGQFALYVHQSSHWQSPRMCDRLPVPVKVYVNADASFCWLSFI